MVYLQDEQLLTSNLKCHETGENPKIFYDFSDVVCSYVFMNGICDEFANHEGCHFDGGDCCLTKIISKNCEECICKEDMSQPITYAQLDCDEQLMGDGFCDDDQNNMRCNYDAGDCCAHVVPQALFFELSEWVSTRGKLLLELWSTTFLPD